MRICPVLRREGAQSPSPTPLCHAGVGGSRGSSCRNFMLGQWRVLCTIVGYRPGSCVHFVNLFQRVVAQVARRVEDDSRAQIF